MAYGHFPNPFARSPEAVISGGWSPEAVQELIDYPEDGVRPALRKPLQPLLKNNKAEQARDIIAKQYNMARDAEAIETMMNRLLGHYPCIGCFDRLVASLLQPLLKNNKTELARDIIAKQYNMARDAEAIETMMNRLLGLLEDVDFLWEVDFDEVLSELRIRA